MGKELRLQIVEAAQLFVDLSERTRLAILFRVLGGPSQRYRSNTP